MTYNPDTENEITDFSELGRFAIKDLRINITNKNMDWNVWRMRVYYLLLVVVGGLTALQGSHVGDFSAVIGILTAIETEFTV